jgi:hypothetical protein
MPIMRNIRQCTYVHPDGRRCGSPSTGRDQRCYHHDLDRYPLPIEVTPQLREIADVLADPDFKEHIETLAARCNSGKVTHEELIMTINLFLGFDLREPNSRNQFCRTRDGEDV